MTRLNETEVSYLFQAFNENCANQLLRQTIEYNDSPEAVEAARQVLAYRKQPSTVNRQWRSRLSGPLDEPFERFK